MIQWAGEGGVILHAVFTVSHERTDIFSVLADCLLEAFSRLRGRPYFRDTVEGYRYSIHCSHTDTGPHPHIHVVLAVRQDQIQLSQSKSDFATEISRNLTYEYRQALASVSLAMFGRSRVTGRVDVLVVESHELREALSRLATYTSRVDMFAKDGKSFLGLSPAEVLDIFMWVRGCSRRHRRLRGGSIRRQRER